MIIKRTKKSNSAQEKTNEAQLAKSTQEENNDDLFNLDDIKFQPRDERRRGDRRRGYRRIDERNLVSRAQEEALSIKERAAKDGFRHAIEDARESIDALKTDFASFYEMKETVYQEVAKDILDIAVEVAEKIIKKEVATDKKILLTIVTDILGDLGSSESRVTIKVSPDDAEYLKSSIEEVLSIAQVEVKIIVVQDETVESGSCMVHTTNGVVDARFSTQLEIIKEILTKT